MKPKLKVLVVLLLIAFLFFLIVFIASVSGTPYDRNCDVLGNCLPQKGTGGSINQTIYQNISNTYINQTLNITNNLTTVNNITNNITNNFTNNITYNISNNFTTTIINNIFDQWLNTTSDVRFNRLVVGNGSEDFPSLSFDNNSLMGFHVQASGVIDANVINQFRIDIANSSAIYDFQRLRFLPAPDSSQDLGYYGNMWKDLFLSNNLTDGTNNVSIANLWTAYQYNSTGNIRDWNNTGLIINWSNVITSVNYNATGLILNWTNQADNNKSGLISDWSYILNSTGLIQNWSNVISGGSGITNGSSAWLQNLSVAGDFLVDGQNLFVNSTSNFVGINTTDAQSTLSVNGDLNVTRNIIVRSPIFLGNPRIFVVNGTSVVVGNSNPIATFTTYEGTLNPSVVASYFYTPIGIAIIGNATRQNVGDFGVGIIGTGPGSGVISNGNFLAFNQTAGISSIDVSPANYPYTLIATGNINRSGMLYNGTYVANRSLTYVRIGNILNITNTGQGGLPPFTGTGAKVCSNATNSAFNGTIMKNNTGVYGCPMTASANWTKIF